MFKIFRRLIFWIFTFIFFSCNGQLNTNAVCKKKFKEARDLVYTYPTPTRQSALDSALILVNQCLECDSIRKAVVDLKITLLIALKKYSEGMSFVDSLKESDFTFNFKKKMTYKNFQAFAYDSKNDTINRNLIYKEIADDLEQYIKKEHVNDKEFEEIYIYLYEIKKHYLDATQINKEIELLKKLHPDKELFFEFFKQ